MSQGTNKERIAQNNAKLNKLIELVKTKAGISDEWQPNPTWWDIKTILENDTREYPQKTIYLLTDMLAEETFNCYAEAYATSDGAFYEGTSLVTTHTWDTSKDKPCLVDGKEVYKTRYVIVYQKKGDIDYSYNKLNVLYVISKLSEGCTNRSQTMSDSLNLEAVKGQQILTSLRKHFFNCYNLKLIEGLDTSNATDFSSMFSSCYSLKSIPKLDTSNGTTFSAMFSGCYALQSIPELDTSNATDFSSMFSNCYTLQSIPELDTSNGILFTYMFSSCYSLKSILKLDTSKGTKFNSIFSGCYVLKSIPELDTSNGTNFNAMFNRCYTLQSIPKLDTSKNTDFSVMFSDCRALKAIPELDTSNGTNFNAMFQSCYVLKSIPELDTSNGTNFSNMFYRCEALQSIPKLDLINAAYISSIVSDCKNLANLTLKNIKLSLQIGSSTSWGTLLTLDSLLNTIKELWDNTSGTSTKTLTVSTPSKTLLQNTYVKLVDITDEMRAEDEYIDNKKPFEVCESTDEGAMTAEEYVISKNWQLA